MRDGHGPCTDPCTGETAVAGCHGRGENALVELLIEREREAQALGGVIDAAVAGNGGALLIEGEAGIGKTRLRRRRGAEPRAPARAWCTPAATRRRRACRCRRRVRCSDARRAASTWKDRRAWAPLAADRRMIHSDPLTAVPSRNSFLRTVTPYLKQLTH